MRSSPLSRARKQAVTACIALATASLLSAQYARPRLTKDVTIEQKLNSAIPLNLAFHNEANQLVPLSTYFGDKPVVLSFVYFTCTSLCPMSLRETVLGLRRISLEAGRDYNVVVVSFDPNDKAEAAAKAKDEYRKQFDKAGYDQGFHFLTGDETAIAKLTSAAGWRYRWDQATKQFIHAGGIMVVTPDGKMSRYFYGIDYAAADLRMALVDASKHKIGSPVDYVLLFCFHYDALQGKYTLAIVNLLKLAGALTLLLLVGLIFFLMRTENKKKNRVNWKEAPHAG
ncbi:MAG TPA: SCO family protein [Bryobacteraceae bacterium]|nr:SCO family protein [Bryobacteraceae bacterium]